MINSEEKLEQFKSSVLKEVQRKSEKIISDAKQENAKMIIDISDRHFIIAEKQIEEGKAVILSKYSGEVQSCKVKARKELLSHRLQLVEKVFGAVEQKLKDFAASGEYPGYLQKLVRESGVQAGEIKLSAKDYERCTELLGEFAKSFAVSCDDALYLGGLKLIPQGGSIVYDFSFDTALELQREGFSDSFDLKL